MGGRPPEVDFVIAAARAINQCEMARRSLGANPRTLCHVAAVLSLLAACTSAPSDGAQPGEAGGGGEGDGSEANNSDASTAPSDSDAGNDGSDAASDAASDSDAPADAGADSSVPHDSWTWMSGATTLRAPSTFGTKGVADPANTPGYRGYAAKWRGASDALWLFGGLYGASYDNDLWKFDGTSWTWVSGSMTGGGGPSYGTKGVADASNVPGARFGAAHWTDAAGNLWLYGGFGVDSMEVVAGLSDLWKFDGTYWTWMGGSNVAGKAPVYGTKGVADAANTPGASVYSIAWTDAAGKVWLFGGESTSGINNTLWSFDGTEWTWVDGKNGAGGTPTYIVHGAPGSYPGSREKVAYARDASGTLWMYGGYGDASDGGGDLGDLWKFDNAWTWVAGAKTKNPSTVFGTKGVAAAANDPGALVDAALFTTPQGIFVMSGSNLTGFTNALFRFDGTSWTWVTGSSTLNQNGVYGTKGLPQSFDIPGSRYAPAYWSDSGGFLWIFGGDGYDQTDMLAGGLNDLWRYRP